MPDKAAKEDSSTVLRSNCSKSSGDALQGNRPGSVPAEMSMVYARPVLSVFHRRYKQTSNVGEHADTDYRQTPTILSTNVKWRVRVNGKSFKSLCYIAHAICV